MPRNPEDYSGRGFCVKCKQAHMFTLLCACVTNASHCCPTMLFIQKASRATQAKGKNLLIRVFNGPAVPSCVADGKSFLQDVFKVSLYCRWLAVSFFPEEYAKFQQRASKKHPDSSVLSFLYFIVEDVVLTAAAEDLSRQNPQHLSLHYDGVRVYGRKQAFLWQFDRSVPATFFKSFVRQAHPRRSQRLL